MVLTVSILILPCYFDKKRGRATAIQTGGFSAGQFIPPILIKFLLDEYGFKGSCIIYGGILLNTCVSAFLFHPLKWHAKRQVEVNSGVETRMLQNQSKGEFNNFRKRPSAISISQSAMALSVSNIGNLSKKDPLEINNTEKDKTTSSKKVLRSVFVLIWEYLKVLRYVRANIISFGFSFFMVGFLNFLMITPFILESKGCTLQQTTWAITASGISNMVIRFLIASLSDLPKFNKTIAHHIGLAITAISTICK